MLCSTVVTIECSSPITLSSRKNIPEAKCNILGLRRHHHGPCPSLGLHLLEQLGVPVLRFLALLRQVHDFRVCVCSKVQLFTRFSKGVSSRQKSSPFTDSLSTYAAGRRSASFVMKSICIRAWKICVMLLCALRSRWNRRARVSLAVHVIGEEQGWHEYRVLGGFTMEVHESAWVCDFLAEETEIDSKRVS